MTMLITFSLSCVASFYEGRLAGLLVASLLMTASAPLWATPKESADLPRQSVSMQQDYARRIRAIELLSFRAVQGDQVEVVRTIEAYPEVVVFPILVAGPVSAVASKNIANKVAQAAGSGTIAVIYPDIGEPYRSVFTQIIDGIESKANGRVTSFLVGANVDVGELNSFLRRQDARVVIALGRQGVKAAAALDSISVWWWGAY
jgi:hypothetical protein